MPEVRLKEPLLLPFLSPAQSRQKGPPSARRPCRLLPKHQSASKSGVWRQWLSWWSRRVFQARALVARPGAQLARGAAAVPVYARRCQSVLGRLSSRPCPAFQASQSDSSAWCDMPDRRQEKRSRYAAAAAAAGVRVCDRPGPELLVASLDRACPPGVTISNPPAAHCASGLH